MGVVAFNLYDLMYHSIARPMRNEERTQTINYKYSMIVVISTPLWLANILTTRTSYDSEDPTHYTKCVLFVHMIVHTTNINKKNI